MTGTIIRNKIQVPGLVVALFSQLILTLFFPAHTQESSSHLSP